MKINHAQAPSFRSSYLRSFCAGLAISATLAASALAQTLTPEGQILFPQDGVGISRNASPAEKAWMLANPSAGAPKNITGAPIGALSCPGEYAPTDGIIMAWTGGTTLNNIQRQMIRHITTTGNARVYLTFTSAATRDSIMPTFATNALSLGTDVSKVIPSVISVNSIWLRDYGPRYTYENGNVRVIVDHTYNITSRTLDNAHPIGFAPTRKHGLYTFPLRHGGGNYHLSSLGDAYMTQLIANENTAQTTANIINLFRQYWGTNSVITAAFPTSVDATQHIDMWMQIIGDRQVIISDWPSNPGSTQDVICDNQAAAMAANGYTVTRVPARNISGVHYTYTNVVMCNDLVLIPTYTNATMAPNNAPALAAWQAAMPGKTIVQIPCDALAQLAGVMHCIVMHMPLHKGLAVDGGLAPTVFLRAPRGAAANDQTFNANQVVNLAWVSDDDNIVANHDIDVSYDNGQTWRALPGATANTANLRSFSWTVPDRFTSFGLLRVTARDAEGRTDTSISPFPFTINGTPCRADVASQGGIVTPDGLFDNNDFAAFIDLFFANDPRADVGSVGGVLASDGNFDNNDFAAFVTEFFGGC